MTIGLLDAWSLWLSGQEVDPQRYIGPLTVLWWSRVGKVAAFIGGATVILDLIGPDRLRTIGRNHANIVQETNRHFRGLRQRNRPLWQFSIFAIVCAVYILCLLVATFVLQGPNRGFAYLPIAAVAILAMLGSFGVISRLLVAILDRREPALVLRYVAIGLLAAGFHFDLLAS